jgi:hypothetical protein
MLFHGPQSRKSISKYVHMYEGVNQSQSGITIQDFVVLFSSQPFVNESLEYQETIL